MKLLISYYRTIIVNDYRINNVQLLEFFLSNEINKSINQFQLDNN